MRPGLVTAVSTSLSHSMAKPNALSITLVAGVGVAGDAHAGATVKHRSRVKKDPTQANLRQVHLIHSELHDALRHQGFDLAPGEMGENVTTSGLDLLGLPVGTKLRLGEEAVVEVTGLRNPCVQLDRLRPGLMGACLERVESEEGGEALRRLAGVMAVVVVAGEIRAGDPIIVDLPPEPHRRLGVV